MSADRIVDANVPAGYRSAVVGCLIPVKERHGKTSWADRALEKILI